MNFAGNQLGRITSIEERKSGKLRSLMPSLSQGYYYSIPFTEKGQYGRHRVSATLVDSTRAIFDICGSDAEVKY